MKKTTSIISYLCVFLFYQSIFSQNWQTEGPLIDNLTAGTFNQQLAIDSNNNNYILMRKATTSNNFVLKYDGSSWNTLGPYIADGSMQSNIGRPQSIAIDNNDIIYVAYIDPSLSGKVTVKKWDGSSWVYVDSSQGLAVNTTGINSIVIKTFNNSLYLAYTVPTLGLIVQTFDNTNPWGFVGTAFSIANSAGYVDLAISSIGIPYVIYQDAANNGFTTIKMFNGTNWVLVGNPIASFGTLQKIAFKTDDTPCIVFRDGSANRLVVKEFNGSSWIDFGNTITINPDNSVERDLNIVIDSNDKPYVAYVEVATVNNELGKVLTLNTSTNNWVELAASNAPTGTFVRYPSLALDNQDVLHYSYERSQVTKCVVYNGTLSTDEIEADNLISIYPNPANNSFIINSNRSITNVSIYDVQGKIVKQFTEPSDTYNVENLTNGLYFVNIQTENGSTTKKLIKE